MEKPKFNYLPQPHPATHIQGNGVKPKFNYQKIVKDILGSLPDRPKEVIDRRYGISSGKSETLQEIGDSWKITRERVRQIEKWGFNLIKNSPAFKKLEPAFQALEDYLNFYGGLKKEDVLFYNLAPESQHSALALVLNLSQKFERVQENSQFYAFWSVGKTPQDMAKKVIDFLMDKLKKQGAPIEETELDNIYKKEISQLFKEEISKEAFLSYIEISKEIKKGTFNKIGLASWPEINPKGVKDEAYLVLKKEGAPLHFSKVTDLINKYFRSEDGAAQIQTVHNELIKDPRFVLIGRGVYALNEWGYEPGAVKDVIAKVLKENKDPLKKEEIIDKVMKCRRVKKNTVLLNLQDKNYFKKTDDGRYQLS